MKRVNWKTLTFPILPIIACIVIALIATFTINYQSKQQQKEYEKERQQAQRLIDKRLTESEQQEQLTQHQPPDQPPDHTTEKPTFKDSNASMPDQTTHNGLTIRHFKPSENLFTYKYEDGIYKGMTYFEAHTAWQAKVRKARNRWMASVDIESKLTQEKIDSADAKLSTILNIFKTLSPEELELAKTETIKDYPEQADELESFFNDIANHSTTKSLEEIANDYEFILESDKAIWTATYKTRAEVDKNYAKLEQAKKEKPSKPYFLQ